MTPLIKRATVLVLFAAFGLASAGSAFADSSGDMMNMLESMKRQMSEMQNTINQQSNRIQQLESRELQQPGTAISGPSEKAPELTEGDWEKGIKDNIGKAVPWMKGVKFGGDLRLREEYFDYFDKTNDAGSTGTAADRTRARTRLRLRYGMEKDFGDDWKAGFRLASGSSTDNASTNQTLGNRGYFTFKDIFIERAYAQYSPNGLKDYGPLKGVTIGAGKFENPFQRYGTAITWDGDVTPEGLYEKAKFSLISTEENKLTLDTTMGQFLINENAGELTDAEMFGYQGALTWSTYSFGTERPIDFTGAVSLYDYVNLSGTLAAATNTAATSYQRTNTTAFLLDDPRIIDFYPEIVFHWGAMPVTLWYNYVINEAELNAGSTSTPQAADVHNQDDAFGLGIKIGKLKKKADWEFFYGYYEIGANAVPAAFNDSDFGGPGQSGHTNRLGHKFGLGYQITDNLQFNWTNFLVRPLNATLSTVAGNATAEKVYRTQADLVWKF